MSHHNQNRRERDEEEDSTVADENIDIQLFEAGPAIPLNGADQQKRDEDDDVPFAAFQTSKIVAVRGSGRGAAAAPRKVAPKRSKKVVETSSEEEEVSDDSTVATGASSSKSCPL